ncbi:MAG TPA: TonB family protein, partial [Burkholderiaceae bacterium]
EPVPTPKVEDRTPPVPDADIATAQEKKRLKQEKEEQEKAAQQKKLEDQRKQEELEKKQEEKEKQEAAEKKREEEDKKLAEKKQQQEEQKRLQKMHDEDKARMLREAGGNPGTGSPTAPGKPGGNGAWIGKVQAKIKSLIVFNAPPGADQNATAQFSVSLLPDGSVASVRLTGSSGNPAWDEAVKRAIENAAPYPFDSSTGSVPRQFTSSNRLGDQK